MQTCSILTLAYSYPRCAVSSWIGSFQWNMQFEMMMIKEMAIVLIEEAGTRLLIGEAMIVGDRQVHIGGIGIAQTMAMDQIQVPDLNKGEVPSMKDLRAQSMGDLTGSNLSQIFAFLSYYLSVQPCTKC